MQWYLGHSCYSITKWGKKNKKNFKICKINNSPRFQVLRDATPVNQVEVQGAGGGDQAGHHAKDAQVRQEGETSQGRFLYIGLF